MGDLRVGLGFALGVWDGCMGLGEWSLSEGDRWFIGILWQFAWHGESLGGLVWLDAFDRLACFYYTIINLRSKITLAGDDVLDS